MTGPVSYFRGTIQVIVASADPAAALTAWGKAGLRFWGMKTDGQLMLRISLYQIDLKKLLRISERRGDKVEVIARLGLGRDLFRLLHRPGLAAGLLLLLVMMTALPKRIWFLRIEGNAAVSQRQIQAAAEESGLYFMASVPEIKGETVKNRMLNLVPELSWVGVRFEGGIVTLSVREQEVTPEIRDLRRAANVVAARSGIITSMNVLGGQAVCKPGQAVLEGELLVSGYVDCQTHTQVTQADAEVFALTQRELDAVLPAVWAGKGEKQDAKTCVSLIFGRKRINLLGNSGILPATYDKITAVHTLTLPGGYILPLRLCVERGAAYKAERAVPLTPEVSLAEFGAAYTARQMLAGRILDGRTDFSRENDVFRLTGVYTCNEMIARQRAIESFEGDTKDDGKNSKRGTG